MKKQWILIFVANIFGLILLYIITTSCAKDKYKRLSTAKIEWEKTFGGYNEDMATSIQETKDGGYILCGYTMSKGAGQKDAWVIKIDSNGNKIWDKTFGGNDWDLAKFIRETKDGGYILCGFTSSKGADEGNVWVIKIDQNGDTIWENTFGGDKGDCALSIQETKDGEYILCGHTMSKGVGEKDVWVIKIDSNGNKIWDKTFGGNKDDCALSIQETKDGGYILCGYTMSKGAGRGDAWVIKIDSNGNKIWEKTFGDSDWDSANSVQETKDSGYIFCGGTSSKSAGKCDAWVFKIDSKGNKIWEKIFGGSSSDLIISIQGTKDGGYILCGYTESKGAGDIDAWVIKLSLE